MDILRKSLKAYCFASAIFVLFTLVLAAVIYFTAFKESWGFAGLITALSISALLLGIIEGRITGKKGLITGMTAAAVFILIVITVTGSVFADSFRIENISAFYIIPLICGGIGGIAGTNSDK